MCFAQKKKSFIYFGGPLLAQVILYRFMVSQISNCPKIPQKAQQHNNQYISNPDFYNKMIGFNGPAQGLPTYEEHLMINGSKSSLHHLQQNGSNQRINRVYHQPGMISRSKQLRAQNFFQSYSLNLQGVNSWEFWN